MSTTNPAADINNANYGNGVYSALLNALRTPYEVGFGTGPNANGPGNQALRANVAVGGYPDLRITNRGSDWYFAVCAVMGAATLAFMGLSFTKPRSDRLFHYITAMITLVACIAYFSMGSGLGQTPITVEFGRPNSAMVGGAGLHGTREIFYVRYIDWFVTTPLLLLDLLLTAGVPWPTTLIVILADEVMIVTGLVGALTRTSYKWGYWTFGMVAFFYVVYSLVAVGMPHAKALGPDVSRVFTMCGVLTLFLWFLYPIAWGVAEGGNVIHPDSEAIFYGILDLIAKPVFGFMLIFGHKNITAAQLGLNIYDPVENRQHTEKVHNDVGANVHGHGANGVTGTTANTSVPATTV